MRRPVGFCPGGPAHAAVVAHFVALRVAIPVQHEHAEHQLPFLVDHEIAPRPHIVERVEQMRFDLFLAAHGREGRLRFAGQCGDGIVELRIAAHGHAVFHALAVGGEVAAVAGSDAIEVALGHRDHLFARQALPCRNRARQCRAWRGHERRSGQFEGRAGDGFGFLDGAIGNLQSQRQHQGLAVGLQYGADEAHLPAPAYRPRRCGSRWVFAAVRHRPSPGTTAVPFSVKRAFRRQRRAGRIMRRQRRKQTIDMTFEAATVAAIAGSGIRSVDGGRAAGQRRECDAGQQADHGARTTLQPRTSAPHR